MIVLFLFLFHSLLLPFASPIQIKIERKQIYIKSAQKAKEHKQNSYNISFPYPYPTINICVGSPQEQCVDVLIDTLYVVDWIGDINSNTLHKFNGNQSKTFYVESTHPSAYSFYQNNLIGNQARDILYINKKPVSKEPNYAFYDIFSRFNEDLNIDGIIGLSRQKKFKGKKDSNFYTFLEHIFQQKKINKRIFSISYEDMFDKEGTLYIGELPDYFDINRAMQLNVLNDNTINSWVSQYWGAYLSHIRFNTTEGQKIYDIRVAGVIKTGKAFISFPSKYEEIIKKIYSQAKSLSKGCEIREINSETYLSCEIFDVSKLSPIFFTFENGNNLILAPQNQFVLSEGNSSRIESVIRKSDTGEQIIIGNALLQNYNIAFDLDQEKMYFLNRNEVITKHNLMRNNKKTIISIIIFVSFISASWILFIMYKLKMIASKGVSNVSNRNLIN